MIRAVLFDMDGLMFDTEKASDRAWRNMSMETGIPISDEFLKSLKGRTRKDCSLLMKKQWGENVNLEEIRKKYQIYVERDRKENGFIIKKGLRKLLDFLKTNQYIIGLSTSTSQKKAEKYLREGEVEGYFNEKVYGDKICKGKPNPDIYLACAKACSCLPEECLVLEDSPNGILAGYRAGCHVIMIPDCILPSDKERKLVDAIFPDLEYVISYLCDIRE